MTSAIHSRDEFVGEKYRANIRTIPGDMMEITISTMGIIGIRVKRILVKKNGELEYQLQRDGSLKFRINNELTAMLMSKETAGEAVVGVLDIVYNELQSLRSQSGPDGYSNAISFTDGKDTHVGYVIKQVRVADDITIIERVRHDFALGAMKSVLRSVAGLVKA